MDNIDEVTDKRLKALKEIEKDKLRVARAIKLKSFQVGDPVWKSILPLGMKNNKFGKWLPSWEGPYKIIMVISGNSYMMETVQGERLPRAINGRYLKKYYPSVWQSAWRRRWLVLDIALSFIFRLVCSVWNIYIRLVLAFWLVKLTKKQGAYVDSQIW